MSDPKPATAPTAPAAETQHVDVIVIGGGINGTGIARDCALRGWKVALVEKNDFSAGATGGSSGMIHGGARYLIDDVSVTKKSCLDSGFIQRIAPHMLWRIPFIMPITKRHPPLALEFFETFVEAYDRFQPLKRGNKHCRLKPDEVAEIEPLLEADLRGAVTMDEWGLDPYRIGVENAVAAAEAGARIHNHTEVVGVLRDGDTIRGVQVANAYTGHLDTIEAPITVNATGPWTMEFARLAGVHVRIRPAKGIHLVFDRRVTNAGVIFPAIDGRSIFVLPFDTYSLLGTTDDDFFGDPDHIEVTHDEVEYLLSSAERFLPRIREFRIVRTTAALRPTIFAYGKDEDKLSRDHRIYDHEREDGVKGLLSLVGGKYAAYRLMSEELVDCIGQKLGRAETSTTHEVTLPGADDLPRPDELAVQYGIDELVAEGLIRRHGSRAHRILGELEAHPEWRRMVCTCEGVIEAELRYAVRHEMAMSIMDLVRRTRTGWGACAAMRCLAHADRLLSEERLLDAPERKTHLREVLGFGHRSRRPILDGDQARQEELLRGVLYTAGMLHRWLD